MAERPEVSWLTYRWTDDPDAVPAPGEALLTMRAANIPTTTIPGAGIGGADLVVFTAAIVVDVRAADGRRMLVRHHADDDAPLVPADAPPVLRDAFERAWSEKAKAGRRAEDFAAYVAQYWTWIEDRTHRGADVSVKAMALEGWSERTVRRHVRRSEGVTVPAFRARIVAEHRSSCAECRARR